MIQSLVAKSSPKLCSERLAHGDMSLAAQEGAAALSGWRRTHGSRNSFVQFLAESLPHFFQVRFT